MSRRRSRGGIAILIVLSIVVLLATMAFAFHDLVSSELRISRKDVDRFRAIQLARAGLNLAITLVKLDPQFSGGSYTYLPDPAYQAKQVQNGVQISKVEETYLLMRASEATGMPLENGMVSVVIRDEAGRLNVNGCQSAPELLTNLFKVCNVRKRKKLVFSDTAAADDVSGQLANAVLDWIDPDSVSRPEGAESSWYQSQTPAYKARNAPLEAIDELLLVRHMDRSIMHGVAGTDTIPGSVALRDVLTIHGSAPTVNVNSATPEVLAAIPGIYESQNRTALVAKLVSSRPIRDGGALAAHLNEVDSSASAKAARFLTTRSDTLRIKIIARLGSYEGVVETVLQRDASGFIRTLYWKES